MSIKARMHYRATGRDVSIAFTDGRACATYLVAEALHRLCNEEQCAKGEPQSAFVPNIVYEFENGLAFRLHEECHEWGLLLLEFLALTSDAEKKQRVLLTIPEFLGKTGLVTEDEILAVRKRLGK